MGASSMGCALPVSLATGVSTETGQQDKHPKNGQKVASERMPGWYTSACITRIVFSGYAGLLERLGTNADTLWSSALLTYLWSHPALRS